MAYRQIICLLLLIVLITNGESNRGTCSSTCKGTNKNDLLTCVTRLKYDNSALVSGTYEISNSSIATLQCTLLSKYQTPNIMWQYRKSASAAWSNYGCEEGERFDYSCKNELGGDHESIGQCDISLKHTKNSGFYRCTDVNDNKFATDEFKVEVVGVDVVKVLNRNIRLNQDGYIQVLICSNPEPQILWHGRDQIIELGSSTERYSSMPLIKALKYPLNMQTPNHYADNCWYSTLVIKGITQADESINLFVTTKGFTTEKQITLTHFPKNRAFNRNQISFVLLLLSMNLIYFK